LTGCRPRTGQENREREHNIQHAFSHFGTPSESQVPVFNLDLFKSYTAVVPSRQDQFNRPVGSLWCPGTSPSAPSFAVFAKGGGIEFIRCKRKTPPLYKPQGWGPQFKTTGENRYSKSDGTKYPTSLFGAEPYHMRPCASRKNSFIIFSECTYGNSVTLPVLGFSRPMTSISSDEYQTL